MDPVLAITLVCAVLSGVCAVVGFIVMIQELTLGARLRRKYGIKLPERDKVSA